MKTFYTILLVFAGTIGFSQNWNLINPNRTVFFQHSDSSSITNTIVIDSSEANGSNTTYYTGYAFKYCDTCQGFNYYEPIIYRYTKELLGFSIENDEINNQYNLDDNTIKQHTQLNDSWTFNTNLNATLVHTAEQLILGVLDSIKTIELSNTDTIIISKHYGVIRYPDFENTGKYYELVGYHEGQNSFGSYLPNFWRTYDFNVGDVFCYKTNNSDSGVLEFLTDKMKIKILSNISTTDTIRYIIKKLIKKTVQYGFVENANYTYSTLNYIDTITLSNCTGITENTFGIRLRDGNVSFCSNTSPFFNSSYSTPYYYTNAVYYETSTSIKNINYINNGNTVLPNENGKKTQYFEQYGDSLLIRHDYITNLSYNYNNYGFTSQTLTDFEYQYTNFLIGTIINGDTTGTVYNFPDDLGFEENSIHSALEFYPNPATNQITINKELLNLKIYSNLGQLVLDLYHPNQIIEVSNLPKGLYFIKATDFENNIYTSKLIKT